MYYHLTVLRYLQTQCWLNSPGALAKKSCQPETKCRKLKFSGKLLRCPLNTMVKSPQISQWRNFFYSRWRPSPLVAYCYTLKSCKFRNIFGCILMYAKYPLGLFSQLLAVEDGEMSQTGISITQLRDIYFNRFVHNKKIKGCIAACFRPDFMNTRNQENESIILNKDFMPPCILFHVILEILSFIFHLS